MRGVDITTPQKKSVPLLDSSTFYLKADLKYFITLSINQRDIQSELDAYKVGPIRTIARVNFNYKILKLNFDLGMYTEVSFFANSVLLPAVVDNPLDGAKSLNKGSLFYYGFSLADNPKDVLVSTNMPAYKTSGFFDFFRQKTGQNNKQNYWVSLTHPNYLIYLELAPSEPMRQGGNIPSLYTEPVSGAAIRTRSIEANPLGTAPVNVAMALDLSAFKEGVHQVGIKIFVENKSDPKILDNLRNLDAWRAEATRLAIALP